MSVQEGKRCGKTYVAVPRERCAEWWSRPFSDMLTAAKTGVDGLSFVVDPGEDRTIKSFNEKTRQDEEKVIFVEEFPYVVRGAMVFRQAGRREGFNRDDVATLHTQGW